MRRVKSFLAALLLAVVPHTLWAQHLDPALMGTWTLSIAKSSFGPDGPPSGGTVRWTQHGWVVGITFPNGYVYADAVITDHGCALIGIPANYSCTILIVAPKHLRFTLLRGKVVRRVGDIELIDANTTRAVHRVTPDTGSPYTETTIWVRDSD